MRSLYPFLILLHAVSAIITYPPPATRTAPTRLWLELDPVLTSAIATCVVRAPSTTTLLRSFVAQRRSCYAGPQSTVRKLLSSWMCMDDFSFGKLVLDSFTSQGMEWVLDLLSQSCSIRLY